MYNHQEIESKWQKYWAEKELYKADDKSKKSEKYILDMFPYPSGEGLHVGHLEGYTATDIYSRYMRLQGFNVLHPIGWDAFGLPAENYAIKTSIHPAETTKKSIINFKRQMELSGLSYDWSREINTSDPKYYKWTQWIFLQLYKKGLAYKKKAPVNWCGSCKTVLANEQVVNGKCERCEGQVIQKDLEQWFFKVTEYAEELLSEIDKMDWPEALKHAQRNWIGKSEGALIKFKIPMKVSLVSMGFKTHANHNIRTNWLISFSTKKREYFFVEANECLEAINSIYNSCLKHKFGVHEIVVMPDHVHLVIDTDKSLTIDKILKYLKGYCAREFIDKFNFCIENSKGRHLWTPKGNYQIISNEKQYDEIIKYIRENPEKEQLKTGERLLSKNLDKLYLPIEVFTTRPDTLFGATYLVLAPEHPFVANSKSQIANWVEVEDYINKAKTKNKLERTDLAKEKTGVELKGVKAINPGNKEEIPIWVADYVMMDYGTGAIMAVPGHDERDWEFAKKYKLEIRQVIAPLFKTLKGPDAVRLDKPTVKRRTAYSFVKHWQENKYLCLDWEKYNWHSGIIGGIEEGEEIIEAAKREIQEETGYQNLRFVKEIFGENHNNFFAAHKDENRYAIGRGLLFQLVDDTHEEIKHEHTKNHRPVWIKEDKMREFLNLPNFVFMWEQYQKGNSCYTGEGIIINSGKFNGLASEEAKDKITKFVSGKKQIQYKIRDWLISRQRYWGAPIPIIYCDKCGVVPVPEKDLPVVLPDDVDFKPTGESPLARSKKFHEVKCPKCGVPARRESDTMDSFVCSSWYFLRYTDPHNNKEFADPKKLKHWLPVDLCIGGMEHAVGHLIYARFMTKVLRDLGYLKFDEPFLKIRNQGIILAEDSRKMSKRWGNVVNPDDVVNQYGADTLRMYEMFMGPLEDMKPWDGKGIVGVRRFLDKIYNLISNVESRVSKNDQRLKIEDHDIEKLLHKTIKKVTEDIENIRFNTAISAMMIFINHVSNTNISHVSIDVIKKFLIILSPFAPHLAEELWQKLGHKVSIFKEEWPKYDKKLVIDANVTIVIQVNGKVRDSFVIEKGASEEEIRLFLKDLPKVQKYIEGKKIKKFIYIKDKLVNIVV